LRNMFEEMIAPQTTIIDRTKIVVSNSVMKVCIGLLIEARIYGRTGKGKLIVRRWYL